MNLTGCAGTLNPFSHKGAKAQRNPSRSRGTTKNLARHSRNQKYTLTTKGTKIHEIGTKKGVSECMRLHSMHSLTTCIFFITFMVKLPFLILHILSIPVKIQIPI